MDFIDLHDRRERLSYQQKQLPELIIQSHKGGVSEKGNFYDNFFENSMHSCNNLFSFLASCATSTVASRFGRLTFLVRI
jgi:hypothetical protein